MQTPPWVSLGHSKKTNGEHTTVLFQIRIGRLASTSTFLVIMINTVMAACRTIDSGLIGEATMTVRSTQSGLRPTLGFITFWGLQHLVMMEQSGQQTTLVLIRVSLPISSRRSMKTLMQVCILCLGITQPLGLSMARMNF